MVKNYNVCIKHYVAACHTPKKTELHSLSNTKCSWTWMFLAFLQAGVWTEENFIPRGPEQIVTKGNRTIDNRTRIVVTIEVISHPFTLLMSCYTHACTLENAHTNILPVKSALLLLLFVFSLLTQLSTTSQCHFPLHVRLEIMRENHSRFASHIH